jgi:hypothetical protein
MKSKEPGDDKFACFVCSLNLDGLTGTRIILWLIAITIVSFVIGFGILALTGDLQTSPDNKGSPFRHTASLTPNTTTFALDGATAGQIGITMGAGEFSLRGGAPADAVMEATVFSKAPEWQPEYIQSVNGTAKTVIMTDKGHKGKEWFAVHSPNSWEILLNNRIPLDLDVSVGAGHSTLDLGSVSLKSLAVKNGAGETEIDLTGYSGNAFMGEINSGVGDLTLRVSKNSNILITVNQGVGDIDNNGFTHHDSSYTTPGYNPELPVNQILVEQGVGDIRLEAV